MERCTFLLPLTTAGEGESSFIYITFMHMVDVFTQSHLHCIQVTFNNNKKNASVLAFPGNPTLDFAVSSYRSYGG